MASLLPSAAPSQGASSSDPSSGTGDKKTHRDQPRIRRRNRLITSCLECRRRKLKCDKKGPCANCTKFARECLFIAPALDPVGQAKLAEVKEKMGMLERTLERDVARRDSTKAASAPALESQPPLTDQEENLSEQEDDDFEGLEPSSLATEDCAYYEDEGNDDIVDLGISMGRLRITERIGGFVRPRFSEELAQALKEVRKEQPNNQNPFTDQSPETWMAPGRDYVAPSSSFFFAPGVHQTSLTTYLPSQTLVDKLMEQYWRAVHVIARTVHRPLFERQYARFWADISSGIEPRVSFQAVLFAALLSAAISMSDEKVLTEFGVAKTGLVENFKLGAEAALARANFLQTTKLETLQAFVMYLIPLCRAEVSRAHSALTGTCIRLAECMSLHRDPSVYTSDPIEIHIRRLIWYQICFLDLRTCESTGPRPQIRRDEHDTKFPLNVDDADLEKEVPVTEDRKYFTGMTITRMRFECYEMLRQLWIERPKLESKKTTLTSILSKIQKFCQGIQKTYLPLLNRTHPLHVLAAEIYGILSSRMYIGVLQLFVSNDQYLMPEKLRSLTISSAVMILEHSMTIEQTPALADWAWYIGALHQYHVALLLISELYAQDKRDPGVEARAWKCLDFVFDLPANLSAAEKTHMILEELAGRTQMYQQVRRLRAPAAMGHAGRRANYRIRHQRTDAENSREPDTESSSPSVTSGTSINSFTGSSAQSYQPPQQQHQHQPPPPPPPPPQLTSMPPMSTTHYGTAFSIPGANTSGAPMPTPFTTETHGLSYTPGFTPSGGQPSGPPLAPAKPQQQNYRNNGMGNSAASSGTYGAGAAGSSPPRTMPEIDWNEWDQLFGTAEMSANIMIPPYTFPQFSPADLQLQWPPEAYQ